MKSHPFLSGAFVALLFAAALLSGCVAQPESPVPTVASLPTSTGTRPPTETAPPTDAGAALVEATAIATIEPSPTEEPLGEIWYANGQEDLVYVYDCRELTCGKIATFARGDEVEVLAVDGDWALVSLDDGSLAFVQAGELQETPLSTASPTATPTGTSTATLTATRTPSPTGTRLTPTFTWTLRAPGTAIPTLPLVGPSIIGGAIGLPGGTANPDGVVQPTFPPPTSVGRQPPGVPTLTPSRTSSPSPSPTLSAPIGTSTLPPIVVATTSGGTTEAPPNTPPGAGSPVPTSGPPVGGPQPPTQATTPTSGPPPGVLVTPPGA